MSKTVQVVVSEERLLKLFAGGNHYASAGDDMGLNIALNAIDHAVLDLRILAEIVGSDLADKCFDEVDLGNRLHWLMRQLDAAGELAKALHGQKCGGDEGEVNS